MDHPVILFAWTSGHRPLRARHPKLVRATRPADFVAWSCGGPFLGMD